MLFPLESILQFPQGVLSPDVVYARGGNGPIPLFKKKMQIATAFLPGAQLWIAGKCQPLLLYFGSTLLENKQHLAAPKITELCSAGPNHNSPEKLRLQTCLSCFQVRGVSKNSSPCAFYHRLPHRTTPKGRSISNPQREKCHSGFKPDIPGI